MKRKFILFFCICGGFAACQDEYHTVPYFPSENDPETDGDVVVELYDWEKNRTELLTSTDMVLLYGGGLHRTPYTWDKERVNFLYQIYSRPLITFYLL